MNLKKLLNDHKGFSLTEMMVVVGIIGVLLAIAIPAFFAWLPGYRLKNATKEIKSNFQLAKLEAIKRGGNVCMEFFPAGAVVPGGRAGRYVIFIDGDGDMSFDAGETSLTQVTMPADVTMTASSIPVNVAGNPALFFQSRGLPNTGGNVTLVNGQNIGGRAVLSLTGRITLQRSINGVDYSDWD